jgi:hypothetical protein
MSDGGQRTARGDDFGVADEAVDQGGDESRATKDAAPAAGPDEDDEEQP